MVHPNNIQYVIDTYNFFKNQNLNYNFVFDFNCNFEKEYLEKIKYYMNNLFIYWYKDKEPLKIRIFINILESFITGINNECTFSEFCSTAENLIVIDNNGDLYPCSTYVGDYEYKYGNINNVFNLDMIKNSMAYLKILENKKVTKIQCDACKYYKLCFGGCSARHKDSFKDYYCEIWKDLFFNAEKILIENGYMIGVIQMNKNILRLLVGQFVTVFGTQIYTFAVSYYILKQSGSGLLFGVSLALGMLPQMLFSPIAGVVSDRYSRKKIVVMTDVICGGILLFAYLASCITGLQIFYIYILMFSLAVMGTFNAISLQAALPNIVDKEKLSQLNSLSQSVASFARITAPFVGGIIIISINIRMFLIFNSVSFFIAALLEYQVVFNENILKTKKNMRLGIDFKDFIKEFQDSLGYCRKNTVIYLLIIFMISMNFLFQFGFTVPIPYIINNTLQLSSQQYGIIQGMTSMGAFLTSLILARTFKVEKSKKLLVKAILGMASVLILMGMTTIFGEWYDNKNIAFLIFAFLNFVFGGTIVASNIPINVILQSSSDDSYRGRVMGISGMMSSIITPLSVVISGALLDYDSIQPYGLCFVGGGVLMILITILSRKKEMRD